MRSLYFHSPDPVGRLVRGGLERRVVRDLQRRGAVDLRAWRSAVRDSAWARYADHRAPFDAAGRAHLRTAAFVLALHERLSSELGAAASVALLKSALADAYRPLFDRPLGLALRAFGRPLRLLASLAGSRWLVRLGFGRGFTVRTMAKGDEVRVQIDRCLYHQFFLHCRAPELTAVICHSDHAWIDVLGQRRSDIVFARPETLGWGGSSCIFHFTQLTTARAEEARCNSEATKG